MRLTKDLTPKVVSELLDEELIQHYTLACQMTARDIGEELSTEMTILIGVRTLLKEQIEIRFRNLLLSIAELEAKNGQLSNQLDLKELECALLRDQVTAERMLNSPKKLHYP